MERIRSIKALKLFSFEKKGRKKTADVHFHKVAVLEDVIRFANQRRKVANTVVDGQARRERDT